MRTPRYGALICGLSLLWSVMLVLGSCANGSSGRDGTAPAVVATTSIWADVTSQVACGRVDVASLVPLGSDTHSYEPSVQDADMLRDADLVVANGLGLEEAAADALRSAEEAGVDVVELGERLDPVRGRGGDEDPHVWMDPDRVAAAVPLIAQSLKNVAGLPVDADDIDRCAAGYVAQLAVVAAELDERFASLTSSERELVTNHESLDYFADRFGFEVTGSIIPSTSSLGESSVRDIEDLVALMEARGVTRIYDEATGSGEASASLAEQLGPRVEVIELFTESLGGPGSGAATYLDMLRSDGDRIAGRSPDARK